MNVSGYVGLIDSYLLCSLAMLIFRRVTRGGRFPQRSVSLSANCNSSPLDPVPQPGFRLSRGCVADADWQRILFLNVRHSRTSRLRLFLAPPSAFIVD
jgi:hypothetical protein